MLLTILSVEVYIYMSSLYSKGIVGNDSNYFVLK